MDILLVHPSLINYAKVYMRLEPLGMERVAAALRMAGHRVHLMDLQVFRHRDYYKKISETRPRAVGFSLNYLANVPEVIDLAVATKPLLPDCLIFVGGHTASFIPRELLEHAGGSIDCIVKGEGEITAPLLMEAFEGGGIESLPGVVTRQEIGPDPALITRADLDHFLPARDLLPRRDRYFAGELDPCASIEFTRGCPWNCSFCSAWTFYNRTYRKASPEGIIDDLSSIAEPNVFLLDDVALLDAEHSLAIAREVEKRNIRKRYYMETRCDVLIRNEEIFAFWKKLGLRYLFLGFEAIDAEGLKSFRKKVSLNDNFRALEIARKLGVVVAINIIVGPDWDESRFRIVEEWAKSVPEIVHLSVMTPYPGTETWADASRDLTTLDYRLFDIHHAVLPTRLPLAQFYQELVKSQAVLYRKHIRKGTLFKALKKTLWHLGNGHMNFARSVINFRFAPDPRKQLGDHSREVRYAMQTPETGDTIIAGRGQSLFIHSRAAPGVYDGHP